MAETTVNQETNGTAAQQQETRTFTQEQMNAIIADRVKREREKYADYETLKEKAAKLDAAEEAGKTELQKATEKAASLQQQLDVLKSANTVRNIRAKVAKSTGVPEELLHGDTEEACSAQAKAILEFAKPGTYPAVKDGGEVQKKSGGTVSDEFAEWFRKQFK